MKELKVKHNGQNPFIEDPKYPHKLIINVTKDNTRSDFFEIVILHPNRNQIIESLLEKLEKLPDYSRKMYDEIMEKKSLKDIEGVPQKIKDKYTKKDDIIKDPKYVTNTVLYKKVHRCKNFMNAMDKANEIKESLSHVKTYHEKILYKSHGKKGHKGLRTDDLNE